MPRDSAPVSASSKGNNKLGAGCLRLFFIPFAVAGAAMFYFLTWKPVAGFVCAQRWEPASAIIKDSRVASSSSSDGTTYRVDITYSYEYRGTRYESARYDFSVGSSSGRTRKQEIVDRYPPGKTVTCYVNPSDPHEAVLERGFTRGLLVGLFSLPFLAIGFGGLIFAPVLASSKSQERARMTTGGDFVRNATAGGARAGPLRSTASPKAKFIGVLLFSLFWNGIISFFVAEAIDSFRRGRPEWFLAIFITPFVLIGLGALALTVYQFLNLFNPRIQISLDKTSVRLGDRFQIDWSFTGRASRVRKLTIFLEGVEKATYRRGTSTATDRNVFMKVPLIETEDSGTIHTGSASSEIPAGLMHTFKASNNEIVWTLKVLGDIPRFPDVSDEFEITILPKATPVS